MGCAYWRDSTSGGVVGLLVVNALACIRTFRMGGCLSQAVALRSAAIPIATC